MILGFGRRVGLGRLGSAERTGILDHIVRSQTEISVLQLSVPKWVKTRFSLEFTTSRSANGLFLMVSNYFPINFFLMRYNVQMYKIDKPTVTGTVLGMLNFDPP